MARLTASTESRGKIDPRGLFLALSEVWAQLNVERLCL